MNDAAPSHRLAFIGGLHKSGTSLLFRSLRDHPDTSGFQDTGVSQDEGQHLQSVYPPALAHGGAGRFGFDPRAALDESSALVSEEHRHKLLREWSGHWDLEKSVLLEKSPPNLIRTRFLQALFPGSRFIVILRHPLPVSLATRKFHDYSLYSLVAHWLACHERFADDRRHLDRLLIVRYGQLVREPEVMFRRIHAFLGLHHISVEREFDPDYDRKYFARWDRMRQGELSRWYAHLIRLKFDRRLEKFGYTLRPPYSLDSASRSEGW